MAAGRIVVELGIQPGNGGTGPDVSVDEVPSALAHLGGAEGLHVVVVGAGGNIGSNLVPQLARQPWITRLTLVDRDHYEAGNLQGQNIRMPDIGRPKAVVQAERARSIRSDLEVCDYVTDLADLPRGCFSADVIFGCLDSRRARQSVNEIAWGLGVPWIDGGVLADGLLARVDMFVPGADRACLECGWSQRDYELLEQEYLCRGEARGSVVHERPNVASTGAPSGLGALCAALQALELEKLVGGYGSTLPAGGQVLVGARPHSLRESRHPHNPECRFGHDLHRPEVLNAGASRFSVGQLLDAARERLVTEGPLHLSVPGMRFATGGHCPLCGHADAWVELRTATDPSVRRRCPSCTVEMVTPGWLLTDSLSDDVLGAADQPLDALGLRAMEWVALRSDEGSEVHFILGGEGQGVEGTGGPAKAAGATTGAQPTTEEVQE